MQLVILVFENAVLGYGDFITIYDGDNANATLLWTISASNRGHLLPNYASSQQFMLVTFTSDSAYTAVGFKATYFSAAHSKL
jgi:CUB domain